MITAPLRNRLTPFGEQLASALAAQPVEDGIRTRVIAAAEAVEPMRVILARHGLEEKKRIGYKDGSRGVSWHDDPAPYIQQWTNQESAIVLKEDAEGPLALRFVTRIAADMAKTTYMIGDNPASVALLRAAWDVGIRRVLSETHRDRVRMDVPGALARAAKIEGLQVRRQARDDGWIEQVTTIERRP